MVSDRVANGVYEDQSGEILLEGMRAHGALQVEKHIVPDEIEAIRTALKAFLNNVDIVLVTGGTGIGPRDVTPEAVKPLLDRELPGVAEALRRYSQDRMPLAMFSRSVAGVSGSTVIVALPGSPGACTDAIHALFPALLHGKEMLRGGGHT